MNILLPKSLWENLDKKTQKTLEQGALNFYEYDWATHGGGCRIKPVDDVAFRRANERFEWLASEIELALIYKEKAEKYDKMTASLNHIKESLLLVETKEKT